MGFLFQRFGNYRKVKSAGKQIITGPGSQRDEGVKTPPILSLAFSMKNKKEINAS